MITAWNTAGRTAKHTSEVGSSRATAGMSFGGSRMKLPEGTQSFVPVRAVTQGAIVRFEEVTIGNARLIHGDCREVLPLLPKHDLLLTDPPYGIGVSNTKYGNGKRAMDVPQHDWDAAPPAAWLFGLMMERSAAQIVWGGNYFGLPAARCWLVWDKCTGANAFADCELAWTSLDAAVRKLAVPWVGANATDVGGERPHPTLKPTRLMTWCLDKVPGAMTVLDPFMGSGTTGVACVQMGRAFTGIEREAKYFDIACERIAAAQAQGALFDEAPAKAEQQGLCL